MAKKIINAQMKQRIDTKDNWASKNPVLLLGELGMVSDDPNLYKVGDGTTAWNALPFRGFDGTIVQETGTSENTVMSQKAVTEKLTELSEETNKLSFKLGEYGVILADTIELNSISANNEWELIYKNNIAISPIYIFYQGAILYPNEQGIAEYDSRVSFKIESTKVYIKTPYTGARDTKVGIGLSFRALPDEYIPDTIARKNEVAEEITSQNALIAQGLQNVNDVLSAETEKVDAAIVQQNVTIQEATNALEQEIESEFAKQNEQIAKKAFYDGKYPELTAGFASNLIGRGEAVPAEINFRPTGGGSIEDGTARIKELKGNAVVWNQRFKVTGSCTVQHDASQINVSVDGNVMTQSHSDLVSHVGSQYTFFANTKLQFEANHKYMFCAKASSGIPTRNVLMGMHDGSAYQFINQGNLTENTAFFIYTPTAKVTSVLIRYDVDVTSYGNANTISVTAIIVDLTQMFGAGNEPLTIEEFYARMPQGIDLYAYNEGELIADNTTAIKQVGFNAWDEQWENGVFNTMTGENSAIGGKLNQIRSKNLIDVLPNTQYYINMPSSLGDDGMWVMLLDKDKNIIKDYNGSTGNLNGNAFKVLSYVNTFKTAPNARYMRFYMPIGYGTTYNNDICIHLVHSGYRNGEYEPYKEFIRDIDTRILEAFPDGRKSAGTAYDKVYNRNGKGVIEKRVGVVGLGALDWSMGDSSDASKKRFVSDQKIDGIVHNTPATDKANIICNKFATVSANDTYMLVEGIALRSVGDFVIYSETITSPESAKAAMQGVLLYYELAEPVITEYDEPFNLDMLAWDFGTEEAISDKPSAPIKADIIYQFNAVDTIRTNKLSIDNLLKRVVQLESMVSAMSVSNARED